VASEDHAKRLLDLGSGFSSYVLRAYAAGVPGAVGWSVDDDPAWLEKTRAFLVSEGLSTEHPVCRIRLSGSVRLILAFLDHASAASPVKATPKKHLKAA
jgi:hypothetical protein